MSVEPTTLIGILVGGYFVLTVTTRVLRRMRRSSDKPISYDFTVGELNDMLRKGLLSQAEYEKAKSAVLKRSFKPTMAPFPAGPKTRGFEVVQKPDDNRTQDDSKHQP
jgi:hypothetical protein